jgi:hypothetical protein
MTYKQIQESVQRLHNKFSMLEPTISEEKSVEKSDISQRQALKEHHQKLREEKFEKQKKQHIAS